MKTKLLSLIAVLTLALALSACSEISKLAHMSGSDLMDLVAEPATLYHSGHDMLSGKYTAIPLPGDTSHPQANLTITKNEKGWEVKDDQAGLGVHTFEMTPQEAAVGIKNFSEKNMQCLDQKYMLRICAVPAGTNVHFEGKVKENKQGLNNADKSYVAKSETGYVLMYNDGSWMHLKKN